MAELITTASQTIGPFFGEALRWRDGHILFPESAPGRHIGLSGTVMDATGAAVPDALLEFWQADANGRFGGPQAGTCTGFGRVMTDATGRYAIRTVVPARLADAVGQIQSPHVLVVVFARGLLRQLVTRVYFDGEPSNALDPVLALCGNRAETLIARRDPAGAHAYSWDVVLQGQRETVFFET